MTRYFAIAALFCLTSCALLMDGTTQDVRFETPGAENSMCLIRTTDENTDGVAYKAYPPQTMTIMKTAERLVVKCMADGNREKTAIIEPVLSNNTLLNAGNGFVPGLFLDENTNAMYIYPDLIVVDFTTIPYAKAAQPVYSNSPVAPIAGHIDPKVGGWPALYPSDFESAEPLKQRTPAAYPVETPAPPANPPLK